MQQAADQDDRQPERRQADIPEATPAYYVLQAAGHRDEMNRLIAEAKRAGLGSDLDVDQLDSYLIEAGHPNRPDAAPEGTPAYYAHKAAWHKGEMKRLMDKAMYVGLAKDSHADNVDLNARDTRSSMPPATSAQKDTWLTTDFGRPDQGTFTIIRAKETAKGAATRIDTRPGKPPKPARLILSCLMIAIISALALGPLMRMVSQSWPSTFGVIVGLALGFGPMLLFSDPRAHARKVRIEVSPNGLGVGEPPNDGQSWSAASRIALGDLVRFEGRDGASGDVIYSQHAAADAAAMPMYGGAVGYMTGGGVGAGMGVAAGAVAGGVSVATNAIGNQMRRGRAEYKAMLAATGCVVVAVVKRQPDVVLAGGFAADVAGQLVDKLVECVEDALAATAGSAAPSAIQVGAAATTTIPAPAQVVKRKFCGKCGSPTAADDVFCGSCGTKLG